MPSSNRPGLITLHPAGPYSREVIAVAEGRIRLFDIMIEGANAVAVAEDVRRVVRLYAIKPRPWDLRLHIASSLQRRGATVRHRGRLVEVFLPNWQPLGEQEP